MTRTTNVLVIGGGSGMGQALAARLLDDGARVTIAGRSAQRLAAAADRLGRPGRLRTATADITVEDQVQTLMAGNGPLDHVAVTAVDATGAYAPVAELDPGAMLRMFETKVLGPWLVARHAAAVMRPGGSLTFTSGIAAYRPMPRASIVATANSALDGLARALAVELAPIRVNVISPGWVDTPIWDTLAGDGKTAQLAAMAERLPARRIGTPDDIAKAFTALMDNTFVTGTTVHVDGGHRLV
jgi:NAD(P)-dependent dehydrogenase (short-subunit alcohol dehydrogenase family)